MARALAGALLLGLLLVGYVVAAREPRDVGALGLLLLGIALVTFSLAAAALYYLPTRLRASRRRPRRLPALRRGALVGAAVATLAFLRVLDALSAVTAAFVLAAFAALEGVLSARS